MKQTNIEARVIALEVQLSIYSQPEKGNVKLKGEIPETMWEENPEGILPDCSKAWVATARNLPDS